MVCLVVMKSVYNVDARKSLALLCYIANKLFGQQWSFEKGEESNTNDIEIDHDSEELSPVVKRRQKGIGHLHFILTNKEVNKKNGC